VGKLSPVSWKQLVSKLKSFGFDGPYSGGKHPFMIKGDLVLTGFDGPYSGGKHPFMIKGDLVLTLPNPHRKQIGVDLISRILKEAGISRDEWLKS